MTVTESFSLTLGVSYIVLFVLVATLLFLCHWKHKNFKPQEHSALFAGVLSFIGTFTLFILLSQTASDVCLTFLFFFSSFTAKKDYLY